MRVVFNFHAISALSYVPHCNRSFVSMVIASPAAHPPLRFLPSPRTLLSAKSFSRRGGARSAMERKTRKYSLKRSSVACRASVFGAAAELWDFAADAKNGTKTPRNAHEICCRESRDL